MDWLFASVCELGSSSTQLAHVESNDVRRAYARGQHWDERVRMMTWWANYLDQLKSVGQVASIDRKSA